MCKDTQIYQNGKAESHKFNTFNSTLKIKHCPIITPPCTHSLLPASPSSVLPAAVAIRQCAFCPRVTPGL